MGEQAIVDILVMRLKSRGFRVATEVANFNRSADIAAVDPDGQVVVIECKVSNISQALRQLRTHKHSADRLYLATPGRNMRQRTLSSIKEAGLGLFYVYDNGDVLTVFDDSSGNKPWELARDRLKQRILEAD